MYSRSASLRPFCAAVSLVLIGFVLSPAARAAVITYNTATGATTGGQPVAADVTFITSANTVQITLTNDQADPKSAVQTISGLEFHLSGGQTSGSLTSSSGRDRSIIGNGTYTDGSIVPTGWLLQTVGADLMLNDLGGASPQHTIVGPPNGSNVYASGNSSITNGPHNPHIGLSATFNLNVPGVTDTSTITSVMFQFNTSTGNTAAGKIVPEPTGLALVGFAAVGLCTRRRR